MSASIRPLSLDEFLAWERAQPLRYEFDGVQPIGMTGGSPLHALRVARLITSCSTRVAPPCNVFASELKIISKSRVRYPDLTIACGPVTETSDDIAPAVVFEVLSPSTSLTDRRVKPLEYREVAGLMVYAIAAQETPELSVFRRSSGWVEESVADLDAVLPLPEVGIDIPLAELYR